MLTSRTPASQNGVFLLEALVGLIIFAIGALALVAMQASTIAAQSDAQYRIEAANLVDQLIGDIALGVDRTNATTVQTSLAQFAHHASGDVTSCNYSGTASGDAQVTAWVTAATTTPSTRLPGTTAAMTQVLVDTGTFNRVTVSLCWRPNADAPMRRHTVISYIN